MTGQRVPAPKKAVPSAVPQSMRGSVSSIFRLLFQAQTLAQIPRLFREGPKPLVRLAIQAHNTSEIVRLLQDGWQVNFVSSFPRSGNTWARYLLADVFLQSHGVATSTELPVHPDKIIPDFYCHWIARRDVTIPTPGVFVKTHDEFDLLQSRFGGSTNVGPTPGTAPFRNCKHVYLYRTPEDALVSLYHYHSREKHLKARIPQTIDDFCLANLSSLEENLTSYVRAVQNGMEVLFVPYELLLQYPTEILSNVLRWLGAKHDSPTIERAVSNMQFAKLQAIEAKNPFNEEAFFFRRGRKGSGETELHPATRAVIYERTAPLIEQANQRVLKQQADQRNPAPSHTGQIRWEAAIRNRQSRRLPTVRNLQKA